MMRTPHPAAFLLGAGAVIGLTLAALIPSGSAADAPSPSVQSTDHLLPPCEHEDSHNCTWDASEQGNGHGCSFTDIAGVVTYGACTYRD